MSNSLYACKNFSQAVKTLPCPRCVNDVYAFDTWLHYYLGDIYHNLSRKSRGKSSHVLDCCSAPIYPEVVQ